MLHLLKSFQPFFMTFVLHFLNTIKTFIKCHMLHLIKGFWMIIYDLHASFTQFYFQPFSKTYMINFLKSNFSRSLRPTYFIHSTPFFTIIYDLHASFAKSLFDRFFKTYMTHLCKTILNHSLGPVSSIYWNQNRFKPVINIYIYSNSFWTILYDLGGSFTHIYFELFFMTHMLRLLKGILKHSSEKAVA